ncbi:MAG: PDZ domain-containing protein, partial [Desulfobacula sp.]|nr:PDZ domain-containing protein [Desulfobacula sp.]
TNTVSGAMPLTLPDTTTTNTSIYGNVYGSGGSANFLGSGTSTTYGTKTTYIPYSVRRSDYYASYWIKGKPPTFGLIETEIKAETRKLIGTNKGVIAYAIVAKSPAFYADIFKGDILLKIGNVDIYDFKTYMNALGKYGGQKVDVHIYRDGKVIVKNIQFNKRH